MAAAGRMLAMQYGATVCVNKPPSSEPPTLTCNSIVDGPARDGPEAPAAIALRTQRARATASPNVVSSPSFRVAMGSASTFTDAAGRPGHVDRRRPRRTRSVPLGAAAARLRQRWTRHPWQRSARRHDRCDLMALRASTRSLERNRERSRRVTVWLTGARRNRSGGAPPTRAAVAPGQRYAHRGPPAPVGRGRAEGAGPPPTQDNRPPRAHSRVGPGWVRPARGDRTWPQPRRALVATTIRRQQWRMMARRGRAGGSGYPCSGRSSSWSSAAPS